MITKTLKVRVKDKHTPLLREWARSVNFVFNYINELSARSIRERGQFLSAYDLHPYTKGAGKELGLHSQSLQCVAAEYVKARKQFRKSKLRWRKSTGSNRSLGWVPINTGAASWKNGQVFFNGRHFNVWGGRLRIAMGCRSTVFAQLASTKMHRGDGTSTSW